MHFYLIIIILLEDYYVKTAIVTGSSRGLGAKIAQTLIEKGYNVVVNYKQSKEKAEALIEHISDEKPSQFKQM